MKENFITKIYIDKSRNINNLEIILSEDNRQHLIFTGKNGSGKTSLLIELNKYNYCTRYKGDHQECRMLVFLT